jgi:hypothetical protein
MEVDTKWLDPDFCYFEEKKVGQEFMGSVLLHNDNLHQAIHDWLHRITEEWLKKFTHHLVFTDMTPIHQYIFALEQPWLRGIRGRV